MVVKIAFLGLPLPPRAVSALVRNGITTVAELLQLNIRELKALPGVGPGTLSLVLNALADADLTLTADPWAQYVCVRHGQQAGDVGLATFFLCQGCQIEYSNRAFNGAQPEWLSSEKVEGYCGHCNEAKTDISVVQWNLCAVCSRVVRSIGRSLAASNYTTRVWNEYVAPYVPTIELIETDPPELRAARRGSESDRESLPDFVGFSRDEPGRPLFGLELKSGKKAASAKSGVGQPMARFQLDTTDCDDIMAVVDREQCPIYLVHVQVIGRAQPPTERFHGIGFWWTDLWSMESHFVNVQIRPIETRNAAYYNIGMFQPVQALAEYLADGGHSRDRRRLADSARPSLYWFD